MNAEKKQKQQEQIRQQEQMIQRRKEILAAYPEVGNFIQAKDKWISILLLSGFLLHIVQGAVFKTVMNGSIITFLLPILSYWKFFLILLVCKSTSLKPIKGAGIFCAGVFVLSLMKSLQTVGYSFSALIALYRELLKVSPLLAISDILAWIFLLIVCATLIYLIFSPKSKRLIHQFDELLRNYQPTEDISSMQ